MNRLITNEHVYLSENWVKFKKTIQKSAAVLQLQQKYEHKSITSDNSHQTIEQQSLGVNHGRTGRNANVNCQQIFKKYAQNPQKTRHFQQKILFFSVEGFSNSIFFW